MGAGRRVLRHLPGAGVARHALLLVDDLDAARGPRSGRVRVADPAGPAPLRHVVSGRGSVAGRELLRLQAPPLRDLTWPRYACRWRRGRRARASSADSAAAVPVLVSPSVGDPVSPVGTPETAETPAWLAVGSSSSCRARSRCLRTWISPRIAPARLLPDRDVQPSAACRSVSRLASSG